MWSFSVRRRLIDAQLSEEPWWIARFAKGERSLTPEESEEASRLLRAARSDLRALEALAADPEQEHDVIGFHAQQAVEKALKAVIAVSGTEIPYTHDISFLLDVLAEHPTPVPQTVARADWLTPGRSPCATASTPSCRLIVEQRSTSHEPSFGGRQRSSSALDIVPVKRTSAAAGCGGGRG